MLRVGWAPLAGCPRTLGGSRKPVPVSGRPSLRCAFREKKPSPDSLGGELGSNAVFRFGCYGDPSQRTRIQTACKTRSEHTEKRPLSWDLSAWWAGWAPPEAPSVVCRPGAAHGLPSAIVRVLLFSRGQESWWIGAHAGKCSFANCFEDVSSKWSRILRCWLLVLPREFWGAQFSCDTPKPKIVTV